MRSNGQEAVLWEPSGGVPCCSLPAGADLSGVLSVCVYLPYGAVLCPWKTEEDFRCPQTGYSCALPYGLIDLRQEDTF